MDRASVSFPVSDVARDESWTLVSSRRSAEGVAQVSRQGSVILNGVSVMVGVSDIGATGQQWGKLECNPSRVIDPDGHSLCPASQLLPVLDDAMHAAVREGYFSPKICTVRETNVKRLDIARDFSGVDNASHLVEGLRGVHRPWSRKVGTFSDASRGGAQTLLVGGKRSEVRLYDKNAETGGEAPGVVRWEAQCRTNWLGRYGEIAKLSDATEDRVDSLGLDRWEWSQMGQTVMSSAQVLVERVHRSDLSPTVRRNLIGYLVEQAYGLPVDASSSTVAMYRRQARELGVAMALDGLDAEAAESVGFGVRLDLETGTEVLCVG